MISIIITTYGEARDLKRAVISLQKQCTEDIEIIVVDDNAPDSAFRTETEHIMGCFSDNRIVYIKHDKNKNGAAARNTGLKAAKGEFIAFLDNDDFYLSDRIQNAQTFLLQNPSFDGVCCQILLVSNGIPLKIHRIIQNDQFYSAFLNNINVLGTGSNIFLRKSVLDDVKGFDERFHRFQDVEFMMRVAKNHSIGVIDSVDIVKMNSGLHSIGFKKLDTATNLFLEKFRSDIDALSNDNRKAFYDARYTQLLTAAFNSGTEEEIGIAKQLVESIRPLSGSENSIEANLKAYRKKRMTKEKMLNSRFFCRMNALVKSGRTKQIYNELTPAQAKEVRSFLKIK